TRSGSGTVSRTTGRSGLECYPCTSADTTEEGPTMDDWSEDNFGNDGARTYLGVLTARLVATINEVFSDPERTSLEEDGESLLMPSVEVLALLCERYNAPPPRPATVRGWHERYLAVYDREIDELDRPAEFKPARRKVIESTFRWLESL